MRKLVFTAVALSFTFLMPAWADGGPPSANPDTGQPSANPDTGGTATKPDGGAGNVPVVTVATTPSVGTPGYVHPPGGYVHVPTRVQQLQARVDWMQYQISIGNNQYNSTGASMQDALQRSQKALAQAIAAQAAGTPLPPITTENGQIAPISAYSIPKSYGAITSLYN
jgi:hypothetical protein